MILCSFLKSLLTEESHFGFLDLGQIPNYHLGLFEKAFYQYGTQKLVLSKVLSQFQTLIDNDIPPNFIILGGKRSWQINFDKYSHAGKTKFIKAHAFDYDSYLNQERIDNKRFINHDYAVFLDEYVPFHPDYFYEKESLNVHQKIIILI